MSDVLVRPASEDDCAALAMLVTQLGYPTDTIAMQARFTDLSGSEHRATLVAEYQGRVCGMAGVDSYRVWHRDEPVGHLATLVVDESLRGHGIGSLLLGAAENWLRMHGIPCVVLTSATHRSSAHRFYLKHGYQLTGERFAKTL